MAQPKMEAVRCLPMVVRLSNYTLGLITALVGLGIVRGWWTVALIGLVIFVVVLYSSELHAAKLEAERRHAK